MAVQFIQSNQMFAAMGEEFRYPQYPSGLNKPEYIPADAKILGYYWRIPVMQDGRWVSTAYQAAQNSSTKPTPDAVKVMRLLYPDGRTMHFYVTDTDDTSSNTVPDPDGGSTFAYFANGLGGSLPVMTSVTVPLPIIQFGPASTAPDGTNTFYFTFPLNPNTRAYDIDGIWMNGLIPAATQPTDKTSVADYATWADSNMGDYGEWTAVNATTLSLVSATTDTVYVTKAGMVVGLIPVNWCFDLSAYSTPAAIDGLKLGSAATLPLTPFMLTDNNAVLLSALQNSGYLRNATFSTAVANKLQITTVEAQPKLYEGASLIETAASGACS